MLGTWLRYCGLSLVVLLLAGCVTTRVQPYFETPIVAMQELTLLDETLITVKVVDPYDIVKKVEGVVMEDATGLRFPFRDDGKKGDAIAGDSIWTIKVKVPYDGWAGVFTFQVTAYNNDGDAIIVRDALNEVAPMTTTLQLDIKLPDPDDGEAEETDPEEVELEETDPEEVDPEEAEIEEEAP